MPTGAFQGQLDHERYYWHLANKAIDKCNVMLLHVARVFEEAVDSARSWMWGNKLPKLSLNSAYLELLNQEVEAYRQTMQLAVHMITL
jgi:hypothetical protein